MADICPKCGYVNNCLKCENFICSGCGADLSPIIIQERPTKGCYDEMDAYIKKD